MKKIFKVHLLTIAIYFLGIPSIIGFFLLIEYIFDCVLPTWLLGVIVLLVPLLSAAIRISFWRRNTPLSPEEKNSISAKVFFALIPIEVAFSLIGFGIVLL